MAKGKKEQEKSSALSTTLGMNETKELIKLQMKQFIAYQKGRADGTISAGVRTIPLCFWGVKGIGKTTIVGTAAKELCTELGVTINVVARQLSVLQPFDIGGYPYTSVENHGGKAVTVQRFATPEFMIKGGEKGSYTFLFLDEINRARPEMHNAIMGILDGRGANEHGMADNVFVLAAANPNDDNYGATTEISDEAILDRMIHINVQTRPNETMEFIKLDTTIDESIFRFLLEDDARIPNKSFKSFTDLLNPSDRGLCHLGRILPYLGQEEKLIRAVAKGLIGTVTGELFCDRMRSYHHNIKAEDILDKLTLNKGLVAEKIKALVLPDANGVNRLDEVDKINSELRIVIDVKSRKDFTPKQLKNLKLYLDIVPQDQREKLLSANFKELELNALRDVISDTMGKESVDVRKLNFR